MGKSFYLISAILSCIFYISCTGNVVEDSDDASIKEIKSRTVEDIEFEYPITDTEEISEFIYKIGNDYTRGTLKTEDGALYVDATYSPLSIQIYYNRIEGVLKGVMIVSKNDASAASVKYALESEMMKVISNNYIRYNLIGFTSTPAGIINWPDMSDVEAEVVLNGDGDTIGVYPPLPFNVYYSRRNEVNNQPLEKQPFNIDITIPSEL